MVYSQSEHGSPWSNEGRLPLLTYHRGRRRREGRVGQQRTHHLIPDVLQEMNPKQIHEAPTARRRDRRRGRHQRLRFLLAPEPGRLPHHRHGAVRALHRHPGAPEKDITNALNKHLCRCTAYETNLVGALLAQEWMYGGVSSWLLGAVTTHWRVVHCNLDSRRLVILRSAATKDLYYGIQAISCTATEVLCSAAPCSE